ncbi:MAG TPA: gamma-glutamyl-gamma-aminobutyrate hydrolase family protein [Thermoanaerobaculia bacterium]|nr:gamma-glutamyl-gamma-aminobutyrate hydrolase family protein [Thermoanaerobaculia bacterium]
MNRDRPLIGITTYGREDGRYGLPAEYVDAVRRAGGVALLLPPGDERVDELLDRLDGFVLTGGGDLDPACYGCAPHAATDRVDRQRDASELALARAIAERRLPALAICRGCQVLNVALGGTLHQHLPEVVGEGLAHRRAAAGDEHPRHPVAVEPGSHLASAMAATRPEAVSWHHQAPDRVAPSLRVVARAADGTVEALELPGHPALLAVQWHPELTAAEDASQQRLFDALVTAAGERRRARP